MTYEAVIGLEVHVQLDTETKLFCRCPNRFGREPNTLVCPICLGYPGALPTVNRRAVDHAIGLALALGSQVQPRSSFARKSYFYPDLPKGYQISQHDRPLAWGGELPLARHGRAIRLRRVHLEEDAGKLLHRAPRARCNDAPPGASSRVDFNRCGVPLVEIVSEPDLRRPGEARDYLRSLRSILLWTGTSDGNMQEGSLRCDVNVSVRRRDSSKLGTRVEIKNLNSFRHVVRALEFEIDRQTRIAESGDTVLAETRSFDVTEGATRAMRSKEDTPDYRYFPEPDLPDLRVSRERLQRLEAALPELPEVTRGRLQTEYGLAFEDALLLSSSPDLAGYFLTAAAGHRANPRGVANLLKTELLREVHERKTSLHDSVAPERLARLVQLVDSGRLSSSAAKNVLEEMWADDGDPSDIAERLGLVLVEDEALTSEWVDEALAEHPRQVEEFRAGKTQLLGFFVGSVMRRSGGRANPRTVQALARRALERRPSH